MSVGYFAGLEQMWTTKWARTTRRQQAAECWTKAQFRDATPQWTCRGNSFNEQMPVGKNYRVREQPIVRLSDCKAQISALNVTHWYSAESKNEMTLCRHLDHILVVYLKWSRWIDLSRKDPIFTLPVLSSDTMCLWLVSEFTVNEKSSSFTCFVFVFFACSSYPESRSLTFAMSYRTQDWHLPHGTDNTYSQVFSLPPPAVAPCIYPLPGRQKAQQSITEYLASACAVV